MQFKCSFCLDDALKNDNNTSNVQQADYLIEGTSICEQHAKKHMYIEETKDLDDIEWDDGE